MEFHIEVTYEDRGYDLEIYPFKWNLLSQTYFEGKDSLDELLSVLTRYFEHNRISLQDNIVYFTSNYNKDKRRIKSFNDIVNYANNDFSDNI